MCRSSHNVALQQHKMELLSIVMEMPTSTQRAPKRKEPWGLGVSLTRAFDLPSPFISMRR
jgi:hypothetical protein